MSKTSQVSLTFTADSVADVINDLMTWAAPGIIEQYRQQVGLAAAPPTPVAPVEGLEGNAPPAPVTTAPRMRRTRGPAPTPAPVGTPAEPVVGISPPKPLTPQAEAVRDQVTKATRAFIEKHGMEAARAVLATFNAQRIADLAPESGLFFVARLQERATELEAAKAPASPDVRSLLDDDGA